MLFTPINSKKTVFLRKKWSKPRKKDLKVLEKLVISHEKPSGVLPPPGQVSPLFSPDLTLQLSLGSDSERVAANIVSRCPLAAWI